MANITLGGNPITTVGHLPELGSKAPLSTLVAEDLSEKSIAEYAGKKIVLNIFPSIDTDVCAASARKFNQEASQLENTVVINISKDLPFAMKRFCAAEGLENVVNLSDFRGNFGVDYGVNMLDGPLKGLHSRAVVVLDEQAQVKYTEQVPEIAQEPNYQAALDSLK